MQEISPTFFHFGCTRLIRFAQQNTSEMVFTAHNSVMIADDNLRQCDNSRFATEQLQNLGQRFSLKNLTPRFLVKDKRVCQRRPLLSSAQFHGPKNFNFSSLQFSVVYVLEFPVYLVACPCGWTLLLPPFFRLPFCCSIPTADFPSAELPPPFEHPLHSSFSSAV